MLQCVAQRKRGTANGIATRTRNPEPNQEPGTWHREPEEIAFKTMPIPAIHEDDAEALGLPGRELRWLISSQAVPANHCSTCVIRVPPGEKARPAHSHPNGEEVIYIIRGSGRVLVGGEVRPVRAGMAVLFPQGVVHMLHNTGREEMKVVCFFAPPTGLENDKMYEDVDFPE
jgi:mannose-6-phosphate isomerase-like protein (cupin superfamily)